MSYFFSIIDTGEALADLAADQSEWSQRTFGTDAERGPIGAIRHLAKEAAEAEQAAELVRELAGGCGTKAARSNLTTELADCLLLLLDASRRAGVKPLELIRAAQAKMEKNKARTWPTPRPDQPVEHVRAEPTD